jgi:glycosyltransferase involved in cell wall biosynthesis
MKRVLVITYYWPPAGGAGVQRWLKFTRYLPEFGIESFVLTVNENAATYPQIDDSLEQEILPDLKVIKTDSFEPLKLYGKLFGREKIPYGGFANVSKEGLMSKLSRFIRGNFFVPDARKGWNKYALEAARLLISENNIDQVITTGPPHSTHLVGLALKKELGIRWITDFRDPWTDIYYNDQLLRIPAARKLDERMEREVLQHADVVVANCRSNAALLQNKSESKARFVSIENGFDEQDFVNQIESNSAVFKLVYTGTMAASYRPEVLFESLLLLKSEGFNFEFHLAGNLAPDILETEVCQKLKDELKLHGYLPHKQSIELLTTAHLLVNVFPETGNDKGIPGKLFEYLAARKPIVNIGPKDGDAAYLLVKCDSGKTFARSESTELAQYLKTWMESHSRGEKIQAGNEKVGQYSRKKLAEKYAGVIG